VIPEGPDGSVKVIGLSLNREVCIRNMTITVDSEIGILEIMDELRTRIQSGGGNVDGRSDIPPMQ
jgi:hypothetical protein